MNRGIVEAYTVVIHLYLMLDTASSIHSASEGVVTLSLPEAGRSLLLLPENVVQNHILSPREADD